MSVTLFVISSSTYSSVTDKYKYGCAHVIHVTSLWFCAISERCMYYCNICPPYFAVF